MRCRCGGTPTLAAATSSTPAHSVAQECPSMEGRVGEERRGAAYQDRRFRSSRYFTVAGVRLQVAAHAVGPRHGVGEELHRLLQLVVRLGAAKAEEALAGGAEALAAQAGHALAVVGAFEQVHRQA